MITPVQKTTILPVQRPSGCCPAPGAAGSISGYAGVPGDRLPAWITGSVDTPAGPVKRVKPGWSAKDTLGQVRSRISAFRMDYTVEPGLYAVGDPGAESEVFVSANYKLSFDILRRSLAGVNGWILVIDTKGINVWCAAGKGTFGTEEIVKRILASRLGDIVSHGRVIVPQLGAPGVCGREVRKRTGFRVLFGPVRAQDVPAYLANGLKPLPGMRRIRFTAWDRFVLTPIEIVPAAKKFFVPAVVTLAFLGLERTGILFAEVLRTGIPFVATGLAALLTGSFLVPLLLPVIPFRSFAVKGWIAGAAVTAALVLTNAVKLPMLLQIAALSAFPLLSSYLALLFTGATTFTNISGVKKELKYALPVYIAGGAASLVLVIVYKVMEWSMI